MNDFGARKRIVTYGLCEFRPLNGYCRVTKPEQVSGVLIVFGRLPVGDRPC